MKPRYGELVDALGWAFSELDSPEYRASLVTALKGERYRSEHYRCLTLLMEAERRKGYDPANKLKRRREDV